MNYYDSMGFKSENGIWVRRVDAAELEERIAELEAHCYEYDAAVAECEAQEKRIHELETQVDTMSGAFFAAVEAVHEAGSEPLNDRRSTLVDRLRRKTVAGVPVFPTPIELEAADRICELEADDVESAKEVDAYRAASENHLARIRELEDALRLAEPLLPPNAPWGVVNKVRAALSNSGDLGTTEEIKQILEPDDPPLLF